MPVSPSSSSPNSTPKSPILRVAEYTSLGFTVVGTIIAALTRQILYSATPLTFALILNLVNRQREQAQVQAMFMHSLAHVQQQLHKLDQQGTQLQQIPGQFNQQLIEQINPLKEDLAQQQSHQQGLNDQIYQLEHDLSNSFQSLSQSLTNSLTQSFSSHLQELEQSMQDQHQRLEQQILCLEQTWPQQIQTAQYEVQESLRSDFDTLQSILMNTRQEWLDRFSQLAQIQDDVDHLSQSLIHAVEDLHQQIQEQSQVNINRSDQAFADLKKHLEQHLTSKLDEFTQQESTSLDQQLENLSQYLTQHFEAYLKRELEGITQNWKAYLDQKLDALKQYLNQLVYDHLQQGLSAVSQECSDRIDQQTNDLASSINGLRLHQVDQEALVNFFSQLETRITQLNQQITEVTTLIDSAQSLQSLGVSQQELQEQLISWKRRIQDEQIEVIELLRQQLDQIRTQISKMIDDNTKIEPKIEGENIGDSDNVNDIDDLEVIDLNLGIDFGTSFTKVCFRDTSQDQSEVITFLSPKELVDVEASMLLTQIDLLNDGKLLAGLNQAERQAYHDRIKVSFNFIKMRLADLDVKPELDGSWRLEHHQELDNPETVENLCAYYLCQVIQRSQNWIRNYRSDLLQGRRVQWSANVGVPVSYCDQPALLARFQKVLNLAWLLLDNPCQEPVTLTNLNMRLKQLRSQLESYTSDCHAIPEMSATAWSLLISGQAPDGFYVFFDVGDGTLDGCAFRYWRDEGEAKVDFYYGKVDPTGVTALAQRLMAELDYSERDIKRAIFSQRVENLRVLQSCRSSRAIQSLVGTVVMKGSQEYERHLPFTQQADLKEKLRIYLAGGGSTSQFYKQSILSTYQDNHQSNAGIPPYDLSLLPEPSDVWMGGLPSSEFHRFAVAYGLSIGAGQGPEVRLPYQMSQLPPATILLPDEKSTYEETKDSD